MEKISNWQTTAEQQELLKPLDKLKQEYAHRVAEWAAMLAPEHHQLAFWQAQDVSYEVSLEFAKRTPMPKQTGGQT